MAVLDLNKLAQVGFIVKDVEETKRKFAELFGMPVPPTVDCGKYEVTKTEYKGEPAPDAECLMAFFNLDNGFQIELIQPNEAPSTWREFLDTHGEGIHHIAFHVKGMGETIVNCEGIGMKLQQKGEYGSADGRYAYLAAYDDFKCLVELLESDND